MNFDSGKEFRKGELLVHTGYYKNFPVITAGGSCDLYSASALKDALDYAIEARVERLIVDLLGVQYMDSSGFKVLVRAHKVLKAACNGAIVVVDLQPPIKRTVKLLNLDSLMTFVHTKDQAVSVLEEHGSAAA